MIKIYLYNLSHILYSHKTNVGVLWQRSETSITTTISSADPLSWPIRPAPRCPTSSPAVRSPRLASAAGASS